MNLLEDTQNLSKTGKIVCAASFLTGCTILCLASSQLHTIQKTHAQIQKNILKENAIPTQQNQTTENTGKPEEQSQKGKPTPETTLSSLKEELGMKQNTPAKEILKAALSSGAIHPNSAKKILQEIKNTQKFPKKP